MAVLFINPTGAQAQAEATLAYLRGRDGLENSWDKVHDYLAHPTVARWENCREQGYVISLKSANYSRQLNIAFFEHRNSDDICAVKWEQITTNSPTIDAMTHESYLNDKHNVSHRVNHGKASEMAYWIYEELERFWHETSN